MTDLERILGLWRELETVGADYVLASVVAVQGPSYRKPGALMMLAPDGRRAGAVSGGCLEAQVASRAWWLTGNGPCVHSYSTANDDGDRPFGSGCGGVVTLLLERRNTAEVLLHALDEAFTNRTSLAVATILEGRHMGCRAFAGLKTTPSQNSSHGLAQAETKEYFLAAIADQALAKRASIEGEIALEGLQAKVWVDFRLPRPALAIFGAGDDAQPLLHLAKELGWFVSIADGRSNLVTRERFQRADKLNVLPMNASGTDSLVVLAAALGEIRRDDAAVVMTHSFEQDAKILAWLLSLEAPPDYIGVLGPQRRTRELLGEAARLLNLPSGAVAAQVERWLARLHAPTGLDLGAESPEMIALSILAEIQKFRASATALPLRSVRAAATSVAR